MPFDRLHAYWLAITPIEAQDVLTKLRIADYPWLKKGDKKRFFDEMYKKAYPNQVSGWAMKIDDVVKALRARGL